MQFSGVRMSSCDKSTDKSDQTAGAGASENNQNIRNDASSGNNEHHSKNHPVSFNITIV